MRNASKMATFKEEGKPENFNSNFDCSICLEKLRNPRCLPCLHTYCESCLKTYIASHKSDTDPVTFSCPTCRQEINSPQTGALVEEWASIFPINNWVMLAMEAPATNRSLKQNEKFCDPCKRENELSLALLWCVQCRERLCDMCNKFHRRMKFSDRHEVIKMKDKEQSEIQDSLSTERFCNRHKREIVENYCIYHKCTCCKLCMISEHRFCQDIRSLDDMTSIVKSKLSKEKMSGELDALSEQADTLIQSFVLSISHLEHNTVSLKEDVSQIVAKAKLNLDKIQQDINEKIDTVVERKTLVFKEQIQVVKQYLKVVADCQKLLTSSTTREEDENKRLFLIAKQIRSNLEQNVLQLQAAMNVNKYYVDLELSLDDTFEKLVKHLSLGEVLLIETPTGVSNVSLLKDIETFPISLCEIPCIEQITIEKVSEIKHYQNICPRGVFMKDGTMIFISDSKMLTIYDSSGVVKFTRSIGYQPKDIAVNEEANKKMVFVSDYDSYKIRSYIPTDKHLVRQNEFEVQEREQRYHSTDVYVATSHDTLICGITKYNDNKILLFDYNGKLLKELKTSFSSICASVTEKKFYYTQGSRVICAYFDGKGIFKYFHPDLDNPTGIALDVYENIYVCSKQKGKLHLISRDAKYGKEICIPGLELTPEWIGFDTTGRQLFLSSPHKPIEVYQVNYV